MARPGTTSTKKIPLANRITPHRDSMNSTVPRPTVSRRLAATPAAIHRHHDATAAGGATTAWKGRRTRLEMLLVAALPHAGCRSAARLLRDQRRGGQATGKG